MNLGIDIDGVLADYTRELHKHVPGNSRYNPPTRWNMTEPGWFTSTDQHRDAHREMVLDRGFSKMLLQDHGIPEAMQWALDRGAELHLITARGGLEHGYTTQRDVEDQTMEFLDRYGIPYTSLTFSTDKTVGSVDSFIEDSPTNLVHLADSGIRTYARDHQYNRCVDRPDIVRVGSLREYLEHELA